MKQVLLFVIPLLAGALLAQSASQTAQSNSQAKTQAPATTTVHTDAVPVIPGIQEFPKDAKGPERIAREVRHELLMLPYYTVFDDLRFRVVDGNSVELLGNVVNPSLKSDAEKRVKDIEGVEQVTNHINILPPSPTDDRLRREIARVVFGTDGLSRYGWEAAPSIHIIVNGSRATLVGVVDSEADRNMAAIAAKSVPGLFSVDNELVVAGK